MFSDFQTTVLVLLTLIAVFTCAELAIRFYSNWHYDRKRWTKGKASKASKANKKHFRASL